jgi:hypothetical protein
MNRQSGGGAPRRLHEPCSPRSGAVPADSAALAHASGPSFVIVTQGSVTASAVDGSTCTSHVYTANTPDNAFIDPGGLIC